MPDDLEFDTMKPKNFMQNEKMMKSLQIKKLLKFDQENLLDVKTLLILGFLWCKGSNNEKIEALFQLINPPW
jgi:hypothetical protein